MSDYQVLTGCSLAHAWQTIHGKIPQGYRLAPRIPFVAGGLFETENLYPGRSCELLKARANMALQIRDIPDGSSIAIILTD